MKRANALQFLGGCRWLYTVLIVGDVIYCLLGVVNNRGYGFSMILLFWSKHGQFTVYFNIVPQFVKTLFRLWLHCSAKLIYC